MTIVLQQNGRWQLRKQTKREGENWQTTLVLRDLAAHDLVEAVAVESQ